MRKFVKNELCNIIKQLAKVNEALIKSSASISLEQAQQSLTDCQQSAVETGSKIETSEGEGTTSVHLLEEYCEKLYQLCMSWDTLHIREKELKGIRELLNKVKNSILYELPDSKKEVVFLLYKASMWDSLESVWIAARDDENCNAYGIPIPYCGENLETPFKEVHYEGIVKRYRIEKWGVYDDTAALNRAIAISDGYYGDGSSLVQLCQRTGVPIMIQNAEIVE